VDNEIGKAFAKEQALMKERGKKVLALIPSTWTAICSNGTTERPTKSAAAWRPTSPAGNGTRGNFDREVENVVRVLPA
jgi:hypothetical protein